MDGNVDKGNGDVRIGAWRRERAMSGHECGKVKDDEGMVVWKGKGRCVNGNAGKGKGGEQMGL